MHRVIGRPYVGVPKVGRPIGAQSIPGGEAATPAPLFTPGDFGSDLMLWLDADDPTTLFQDVAGTVPVTADGEVVGTWNDKSGEGFHLTAAADDTTRPTFHIDGTTRWVEFDGVNDLLRRAAALGMYAAGSCSVFVACRSAAPTNRTLIQDGSGASTVPLYKPMVSDTAILTNAAAFVRNDANAQLVAFPNTFIPGGFDGTDRALGRVDTGTHMFTYMDGEPVSNAAYTLARTGTVTVNQFALGASWTTVIGGWWPGRVYSVVIVRRVATEQEVDGMMEFLAAKYSGEGFVMFSMEPETTSLASAFVTPVSTQRELTLNRMIKTLKDGNIWPKLRAAWIIDDDEQQWMVDITGNGFDLTKVGAPTFTAQDGVVGTNADYYDTGWNPSTEAIDVNDFHVSCFSKTLSTSANIDLGLVSGANGIKIGTANGSSAIIYSLNGPQATTTLLNNFNNSNGSGHVVCSLSGTEARIYRNGEIVDTNSSYTAVAPVNLSLHILRTNGGTTVTGRKLAFVSVGEAIHTAEEQQIFHGAVRTALNSIQYGDLRTNEPGLLPRDIVADVIVYGATPGGCIAAYEAARAGKTVALVGGWRERRVGGMSAGGLGLADLDNTLSFGGLSRWVVTRINEIYGRADTMFNFETRVFGFALQGMLDGERTSGLGVPIYWSTGVATVNKNGTDVTSFATMDGRTFSGKQFIDASYEGDLMVRAGCAWTVGREAAGTGAEANNGWREVTHADNGHNHQFAFPVRTTFFNVDPYVVEGNPSSGLLPSVRANPGIAAGAADSYVQSYNFRLCVTTLKQFRQMLPIEKPVGWNKLDYEPFLRWLDVMANHPTTPKVYGVDFTIATNHICWLLGGIATSINDMNAGGGFSLDLWGGSTNYPTASYEQREQIWQRHQKHILGLMYLWQSGRSVEGDLRIPAQLETDARGYGFHKEHFNDPWPGDPYWFSSQLYVREAYRLVGDFVMNGNDLEQATGFIPRSIKTCACVSYAMDSHHVFAMVDTSTGTPRIWNTGNFEDGASAGDTKLNPIPYDVMVPKAVDCTNLLVTFAVSATHVAFGAIRMEMTAMCMSQAAGRAASIAIDTASSVQDVDYTTLRNALLASPSLTGEIDPVLPQEVTTNALFFPP